MFRFSISNLVKFLIGILLVQGVTVLLVLTALKTDLDKTVVLFLALNLAVGVLTALWFTSIADSAGKQALAKAKELFSREREKIRLRAEQEKAKEVQNTHRQLSKEKRRAEMGSHFKTGAVVVGGAVGLGTVMLLSQFVTLGLLTLTAAGGAALGYGARARRERLGTSNWRLLRGEKPVEVIEAKPAAPALKGARTLPKVIREG
jgi:type III secretory pathway component EscU